MEKTIFLYYVIGCDMIACITFLIELTELHNCNLSGFLVKMCKIMNP